MSQKMWEMSVVDYHSIVDAECFSQFCCYFWFVDSCGRDCISARLALPSLEISKDWVYYQWIFILFYFISFAYCCMDFFCTTLERLAPIFTYLHVARQLCCRGPKFIYSFISLSLVSVSLRHCQQSPPSLSIAICMEYNYKMFFIASLMQCHCHYCCDT